MIAPMTLASRRRATAVAGFALLALVAELVGRSATTSIDRELSVEPLATPTTPYYPFLLAGLKVVVALAAAALVWRLLRAHAMASAAERLLATIGHRRVGDLPRLRLRLLPRLWLASFGATSLWFLVQNDAQRVSHGSWPLLGPWLHTYALPVFAVLAILLALGWGAVRDWLTDVEGYAAKTFAQARRMLRPITPFRRPRPAGERAPRQLFGLAFESRPPPLLA
jgi:hypothetical protein